MTQPTGRCEAGGDPAHGSLEAGDAGPAPPGGRSPGSRLTPRCRVRGNPQGRKGPRRLPETDRAPVQLPRRVTARGTNPLEPATKSLPHRSTKSRARGIHGGLPLGHRPPAPARTAHRRVVHGGAHAVTAEPGSLVACSISRPGGPPEVGRLTLPARGRSPRRGPPCRSPKRLCTGGFHGDFPHVSARRLRPPCRSPKRLCTGGPHEPDAPGWAGARSTFPGGCSPYERRLGAVRPRFRQDALRRRKRVGRAPRGFDLVVFKDSCPGRAGGPPGGFQPGG